MLSMSSSTAGARRCTPLLAAHNALKVDYVGPQISHLQFRDVEVLSGQGKLIILRRSSILEVARSGY